MASAKASGVASAALTLGTAAAAELQAPTAVWIVAACLAVALGLVAWSLSRSASVEASTPAAISGSGQDWDVRDNVTIGASLLNADVDDLRAQGNVTIRHQER